MYNFGTKFKVDWYLC